MKSSKRERAEQNTTQKWKAEPNSNDLYGIKKLHSCVVCVGYMCSFWNDEKKLSKHTHKSTKKTCTTQHNYIKYLFFWL